MLLQWTIPTCICTHVYVLCNVLRPCGLHAMSYCTTVINYMQNNSLQATRPFPLVKCRGATKILLWLWAVKTDKRSGLHRGTKAEKGLRTSMHVPCLIWTRPHYHTSTAFTALTAANPVHASFPTTTMEGPFTQDSQNEVALCYSETSRWDEMLVHRQKFVIGFIIGVLKHNRASNFIFHFHFENLFMPLNSLLITASNDVHFPSL